MPDISIHVPRVEDDEKGTKMDFKAIDFNPRPPCGGRLTRAVDNYAGIEFQSTSPVWRTTTGDLIKKLSKIYFNPRPPCGGRQIGGEWRW